MALLNWIEEHSDDDLRQLIEAIEAGDVDEETVERLRALIEDTKTSIREEAVDRTQTTTEAGLPGPSLFTELESALELRPTPPPAPGERTPEGPDEGADVEVEEVADPEARQEAIDRIETLLEPTPGRDYEFYDDLAKALETGDATPAALLTQDTLDALTTDDLERFAERARRQRDTQTDMALADFPAITTALRRAGGRDVAYFENVLRELRGEIDPERLPAEDLEDLRRFPDLVDEAIERVEQHIEDLQTQSRRERSGAGGRGLDMRDVATAGEDDLGEPFEDTDRISGEEITRDPAFEDKFISFARALGKARKLDLLPKPADEYFRLTPSNQRTYYDVTPEDLFLRSMRRGEVTRDELIDRFGFSPDRVPEVSDNG